MKFTCSAKDLANAVTAASKIINAHTTVPILSNVLLLAEDGHVRVRATNLELTLEQRLTATIIEPGQVTVPARLFSGYLSNLPQGQVEIEGGATRVGVACGRSRYDFHALPADEYPPLPPLQEQHRLRIVGKHLREAIGAVAFAASSDEARGALLMSVLFELESTELTMVATDGYRLARMQLSLLEAAAAPMKVILPARALLEVARMIAGSTEVELLLLGQAQNQLMLRTENASMTIRLVDGVYPNYRQVIPQTFDRRVVVDTSALAAALKRAEMLAGDAASLVRLAFSDQRLVLTAASDSTGSAYEELDIEQEGDEVTLALNARYVVEILSRIDASHTVLELGGPLSPVAFRPRERSEIGDQLAILMPLRR